MTTQPSRRSRKAKGSNKPDKPTATTSISTQNDEQQDPSSRIMAVLKQVVFVWILSIVTMKALRGTPKETSTKLFDDASTTTTPDASTATPDTTSIPIEVTVPPSDLTASLEVTVPVPHIDLIASLAAYPDPFNISSSTRAQFHPVVKMTNPLLLDLTQIMGQTQLIPREEQAAFSKKRKKEQLMHIFQPKNYTIGKYDENRVNLYSAELFQDEHVIDGYNGARTLHVGIDLGGPVGTKVYSFWDGVVHSAGYNAELGDYGHVVVVEYDLSNLVVDSDANVASKVWALYGHLDKSSAKMFKRVGKKVKRGEVLGRIGDVNDNGGW